MRLGGAYVQPDGFVSWGVPAARRVFYSQRGKIAGISSRASLGFSSALRNLHFLRRRWLRAGSGSAGDRHRHPNFGATFSG